MIQYIENPIIELDNLLSLYHSVEWSGYTNRPEMLRLSYENSLLKIAAFDHNQLVGLIRVVGDGYSIIFIQDILVRPEYQRQQIGTQLISKALAHYPDYYQIHLLTVDSEITKSFYESVGFKQINELGGVCFTYIK